MDLSWRRMSALLLRDAVLLALTIGAWTFTTSIAATGPAAVGLAIMTALLTVAVGYLAHEWGHLLGAIASRSAFELPATPFESFFLFRFDRERNRRAQFLAMSLGGFAASGLVVIVLVALLPRGTLATPLALGLVGLGVVATFVLEVPECYRVWRGAPLPSGAAYVSGTGEAGRR